MENLSVQKSFKAEMELVSWKTNNESDDQYVGQCLEQRVTDLSCQEMVNHVALARYFRLLECGRLSLNGIFSVNDFKLMFNANPQEWWSENLYGEKMWTVSDAIYWSYIDKAEFDQEVDDLFKKLQSLNIMQRLALVDILECAWRNGDPLGDVKKMLG